MNTTEKMITVTLEDGSTIECPEQTKVVELAPGLKSPSGLHYLGALVNNELVTLAYPLDVDCEVKLVTLVDSHGWRIYRQSVSFLLAKVIKELYPRARFSVEHSLGSGFYCFFSMNGEKKISEEHLTTIDQRMRKIVNADMAIKRVRIPYTQALKQFEEANQDDKYNLLRHINPHKIVAYDCNGYYDLAHGPLALSTGALEHFRLVSYPPGFVIQFPERDNPPEIAPFEPQPQLFHIFQEHKEWGRILEVDTVGRLNETITTRKIGDFVKIAEALHEKKIARIADLINANRNHLKLIAIAGPSSSGKTTFAKRLSVQLRVDGINPVMISLDDYFVDREKTPKTETGEYDFENVETIDLPLFHDHLKRLDQGESIDIPHFNFEQGKREFRGKTLQISDDDIVIIEGIHALNPVLTNAIPAERIFKIYISALTQLNLDHNNRISTTDNRLIRRLVRDYQFRGNSALTTMKMWPNVRKGEKKWIFPFQNEADIAFNSALDYELAILKPFAEPLLAEIKPYHSQYAEAMRLSAFLNLFLSISPDVIPQKSILREFVGKSSFEY